MDSGICAVLVARLPVPVPPAAPMRRCVGSPERPNRGRGATGIAARPGARRPSSRMCSCARYCRVPSVRPGSHSSRLIEAACVSRWNEEAFRLRTGCLSTVRLEDWFRAADRVRSHFTFPRTCKRSRLTDTPRDRSRGFVSKGRSFRRVCGGAFEKPGSLQRKRRAVYPCSRSLTRPLAAL